MLIVCSARPAVEANVRSALSAVISNLEQKWSRHGTMPKVQARSTIAKICLLHHLRLYGSDSAQDFLTFLQLLISPHLPTLPSLAWPAPAKFILTVTILPPRSYGSSYLRRTTGLIIPSTPLIGKPLIDATQLTTHLTHISRSSGVFAIHLFFFDAVKLPSERLADWLPCSGIQSY